jgi:signal transduction histidine kinase
MKALRIPLDVWSWRGSALVLSLMLAPLLATLTLVPDGEVLTTAADARSVLVGTAMLAAGVFLYMHWRITGIATTGLLALLLSLVAVPALALGAFSLTHPTLVVAQAGWLFVFRVLILLGLLTTLMRAHVVPLRADPFALGLIGGLGLAGLRQVVLLEAPPLPTPPTVEVVQVVLLVTLATGIAIATSRLGEFPRWARARVTIGVLLLAVGSTAGGVVALGTGVAGAVLVAATAAAVLHSAIADERRQVEDLNRRLSSVEAGRREDRARLHEIDATIAGIASAQRLLNAGLTAERSTALAEMMLAEVDRLQRLLGDRAAGAPRGVDLDDVIGQIVLAHQARGRLVRWSPTGVRALGRSDDIAEIVNVLLENAAVHGGPGPVSVRVAADPGGLAVTVTVADHGPGIAQELRDRVFDWGVSRPGSPGQGIGLNLAADLARELGGRLELLPTAAGASFALHLPAELQEVGADDRVARAS